MITQFSGMFHFLSNFSPANVKLDGKEYRTTEHAFQAAKTFDEKEREKISKAKTPGEAKRMGRKVKLRPDWNSVRIGVMEDLLRQKFSRPHHKKWLLDTGSKALVEGNTWHDNFWGNCTCSRCENKNGQNNLGMLLMKIRTDMQEEE
jgi:ribA/ribD-fused uncharacterized protein